MTAATKATHTPGPWKLSSINPNCELPKHKRKPNYTGSVGYVWTDRPYPGGVCIAEVRGLHHRCVANTRLIAAAPELLAACQRVLNAIEWAQASDCLTHNEQADILFAAIAKATE